MEIDLKTSFLYFLEKVNGGLSFAIGITLNDEHFFESVYWIHPNGNRTMAITDNFLKLFGVKKTEDLPFLNMLMDDIETILPSKEKIFSELL